MEWGKEIPIVDGKRPEWLGPGHLCCVLSHGMWCGLRDPMRACEWTWHNGTTAIRLPADHPHYKEGNMTGEISAELVERMVAHFRDIECRFGSRKNVNAPECLEALAIAKALPTPPDPEKEMVRKVARQLGHNTSNEGWEDEGYLWDGASSFCGLALACLRAGRDMERGK